MNWLVYHIVSGHAFFTGVILLVIAALASTRPQSIFSRVIVLSFLIGIIAVVVSSTAIPNWLYAIAAVVTVAWIASRYRKPWRRWAPYAVIAVWLLAAVVEIPHHVTPSLDPAASRSVTIIGDSVTAGVGGDETSETWPTLLGRDHQLQIQDLSQMGETAESALRSAKTQQIAAPVVVVEIGGNDLLGSTTAEEFADDLDALLAHLAAPDRQIVMFELPLPPFCNAYGRAQRAVAAKHKVKLIPKRVFLSVIADSGSTLDTIHLSQSGHRLMADRVWRLVESAFAPQQGE